MLMLPPAPLAVALEETAAPEMLTEAGALMATCPPWPAPEVPLSIRAPPVSDRLPRLRAMSPAAPAPIVFTDIFAPSLMARDGVVTVIRPAFPGLSVVLKTPLAAPARLIDSPAAIVTFPPAPWVGLMFVEMVWIWPPFVTLNVF